MVFLPLDAAAFSRVRFATSPSWEAGLSALVLRRRDPGPVHRPWLERVRREAAPGLLQRVAALTAGSDFVVDFLTPARQAGAQDPVAELGRLHELDDAVLQRDLSVLAAAHGRATGPGPSWVAHLVEQPAHRARAELAAVLAQYWRVALAPHWDRFTRLATADVDRHAARSARGGTSTMLAGIHPRIEQRDDGLDVFGGCETRFGPADLADGVLLVPSAFAWPDLHVQSNAPYQPSIAYAVRGLATLWLPDEDAADDRLVRLLGAGRAGVLRELLAPATTAELAHDLHLAPSTVSEHLGVLSAAGLASSQREGRRVVYRLTDLGTALLHG